jgi:hypothetical protein
MTAAIDLGIERLARIDERIDAHEGAALRDRWEFGREMLAARDGAGRLPNGYLAALVERTGKSRTELHYRSEFAARYLSEDELLNALSSFPSWREIVATLKREPVDDIATAEPGDLADGQFRTFVVDPPWRYGNTSTRGAARVRARREHQPPKPDARPKGDDRYPSTS